ncbi:MAG: SDR family NAD(P)-dependent oxidoreductase [Flavisolibacter sp.]
MVQKKLIVIGASSGIGREIVCKYAEKGWKVGITGRRENFLQDLKGKYPQQIVVSSFDVTASQNVEKIRSLIEELGGIDLLIYNAGYGNPSLEFDCESEMITMRTNVNGFTEIVSYIFNYFIQKGSGQIAVTSSVAAIRGNSWSPAYSASKAFMSNYAEGLNIKAHKMKKDIVVTDIRPGFVDTKPDRGHGRFWIASKEKAANQIIKAIDAGKRVAYITRRWWLIGQILKILPYSIYRRIG